MDEPIENLYYALGQLAYAVAKADGDIQNEEKMALHAILIEEAREHGIEFSNSEIIFELLDKDHTDADQSYTWAMNEIKRNQHYFIPPLRDKFLKILERVARCYPPVVEEEKRLLEKFKRDINAL